MARDDYSSRQNHGSTDLPQPLKKPQGGRSRDYDLFALTLIPWFAFGVVLTSWCLLSPTKKWFWYTALILCAVIGLIFVCLGVTEGRRGAKYHYNYHYWNVHLPLGTLTLIAVAVAWFLASLLYDQYMEDYWRIEDGASYSNVDPSISTVVYPDATIWEFKKESFIDTERSVGFMDEDKVYCVAPVTSEKYSDDPMYWAVGIDCCDQRGGFACHTQDKGQKHDEDDPTGQGYLMEDTSEHQFGDAIRMAQAVYKLKPSKNRILLRWTYDAVADKDNMYWSTMMVIIGVLFFYLMFSALVAVWYRRKHRELA